MDNRETNPPKVYLVVRPYFRSDAVLIPYYRTPSVFSTPVRIRTAIKGLEDHCPSIERQGHTQKLVPGMGIEPILQV